MGTKSQQLQIRVSPREKAALRRHATAVGQDLSSYVLSRALPRGGVEFDTLIRALDEEHEVRFALAALNDLLTGLAPIELPAAVERADVSRLSPYLQNYVAAMVEHAAHEAEIGPPDWTAEIPPLETPRFAVPFASLRLHLLRSSPVAFKRRNLFIDASLGARV